MRKFAVIKAFEHENINLPKRATAKSAGYDLEIAETITLHPNESVLAPTGLKVYMPDSNVLKIYIRSSLAVNKHIVLANQVGIIDSDYVDNLDNEGHIMLPLKNEGKETVTLEKGMRVAQGIFVKYETTENDDDQSTVRQGGFGSTK